MNDVNYTNGLAPIATPNLDFLATNGVILDHYYTAPICTPARCALMTGRHMMRTGCHNDAGNDAWGLNLDEYLVSDILKGVGHYHTAIYGKWHLGHYSWQHTPPFRGFDDWNGFLGGGVGMATHMDGDSYDWWDGNEIDTSEYGSYSTYIL